MTLSAIALVALLFVLLKFKAPFWVYPLPFLAVLLGPQLYREFATYFHGFMHISIVYAIFERGVPPENPLFAGEPIRYMWTHHAVIAWLMRVIPVSPPQMFWLLNVGLFVGFVAVVERTARILSTDRVFRVFAMLLALYGMVPLAAGPIRGPIAVIARRFWSHNFEFRMIPITKFGLDSNQIGLLFFALSLLALVQIAASKGSGRYAYGGLAVAILGAAFFYPLSWAGMVAVTTLCAGYFWLRGHRTTAIAVAGILFVCSLVALPFMLGLTVGKPETAALKLGLRTRNLVELAAFLALPAVLLLVERRRLIEKIREAPDVYAVLLIAAGIMPFLFLTISVPFRGEYKFLGLSTIALSFLVGIALTEIFRSRKAVAFIIVCLVVLPELPGEVSRIFHRERVTEYVYSDGRILRDRDGEEDDLYAWIATQTPRDAIFVDTRLTIPVLGRRSLLVGTDARRQRGELNGLTQDGWYLTADEFLRFVTGVDDEQLTARRDVVESLLSTDSRPADAKDIEDLTQFSRGRPVYVVAREPVALARLSGINRMRLAYQGQAASVFELVAGPG